jgi:hypothetical protein
MSDFTSGALETSIRKEFNGLRGRLCGLIESWGLPEKQERGAIQTLKTLSYDSENLIVDLATEEEDVPQYITGG